MLSGGAGMRAMYRVTERMFGEEFSWDDVDPQGNLDPLIFAEAAKKNDLDHREHLDAFRKQYLVQLDEELSTNLDKVQVMPGIHDLLARLRARAEESGDIVLGLLTGNYADAVPIKLAAIDVDVSWFQITSFGDEARTRPEMVALAMKKYEDAYGEPADPHRVVIIGDTPRDVACAHAHGCPCFAVATGFSSADTLREAGAEIVVNDLSDPAPLLAMIEDRSA